MRDRSDGSERAKKGTQIEPVNTCFRKSLKNIGATVSATRPAPDAAGNRAAAAPAETPRTGDTAVRIHASPSERRSTRSRHAAERRPYAAGGSRRGRAKPAALGRPRHAAIRPKLMVEGKRRAGAPRRAALEPAAPADPPRSFDTAALGSQPAARSTFGGPAHPQADASKVSRRVRFPAGRDPVLSAALWNNYDREKLIRPGTSSRAGATSPPSSFSSKSGLPSDARPPPLPPARWSGPG